MGGLDSFPKLLVAAEYGPHSAGGGAALMRQLLRGYPEQKVHWWSCTPQIVRPAGSFSPGSDHVFALPARLRPQQRLPLLKSWMVESFWVGPAAAHLRKTISVVQPDLIWAMLYGWPFEVLNRARVVTEHRCHVSAWDCPDTQGHLVQLGQARCERRQRWFEDMFRQAHSRDVISLALQEDLARRTGRRDAVLVHSGVEAAQIEALAAPATGPAAELRIAFAGTIVARQTFELFVRALRGIRGRLPRPVRLEFFGGRGYERESWFDAGWMRTHEELDEPRLAAELATCAWGLVVMDVTDDNPRYHRFSFPNKFGTQLAAGLPQLVLAHPESSVAQVMRDWPVGFLSSATDQARLQEDLWQVLSEPDPRRRYQAEMLQCARGPFDAAAIRQRLWSCWGVPAA